MAKTFVNRNRKSPQFGLRYEVGPGGSHVYKIRGRKVVIGGKKPAPDPYAKEVGAATALRYGGQEAEIASQRRISGQALINQESWWDAYGREVAEAEERARQGYQQATQAIQGQANLSYQQDSAADAARLAEANRQAALRGTIASEGDAGQAAAARRSLSNAFAGKVAMEGANQAAYGARQVATAKGIKASKLSEEQARRRLIDSEARKLAADKGAWSVDYRRQLKETAFKQNLAAQQFGVRVQDTAADNKRADTAERRQQSAERRQRQAEERQQRKDRREMDRDSYQRKHGLGPYKPAAPRGGSGGGSGGGRRGGARVPPSEARQAHRTFNKAVNSLRNRRRISSGVDGFLQSAAAEWFRNERKGLRGVSRKTAKILARDYGFKAPVAKRRKPTSLTPRNPDGTPG